MLINLRNALIEDGGWESKYSRLEWIESNGVNTSSGTSCSYIDTGVEAKYGMTAHFEWQWVRQPTGSSGYAILFGGGKYIGGGRDWATWAVGTQNNGRSVYNGLGLAYGGSFSTSKSNGWYISNGTCGNFNYESTPKNPWFLFAQNESWSQGRYGAFLLAHFGILRLRYGKIMMNGDIIHEYIPVKRKLDSEIGLIDLTTGDFLTSASEIKFSAGPKI